MTSHHPHVIEDISEENFTSTGDRDWLNFYCAAPFDSWESFEKVRHSDQFDRTRLRLSTFLDGIIQEWQTCHPDEDFGSSDFLFLHERFADWARDMRQGNYNSFVRTLDRRAVRDVLLGMWDFLTANHEIEQKRHLLLETHMNESLAIWMCDILCTVLPFERADCLFMMTYDKTIAFGIHWISKLPVHSVTDEHKEIQDLVLYHGGRPGMNKRFVEIIAYLKQSRHSDTIAARIGLIDWLLVPTKSPLEQDDCGLDHAISNQQGRDIVPLREEVYAIIAEATTIEHFCFIYKTTTFMKYHYVLHTLVGGQHLFDVADKWADDVVERHQRPELALEDLQMILSFYQQLFVCLDDARNHSVTPESIRSRFRIQGFINVLGIAFPLARALAVRTNKAWPEPWMVALCSEFSDDLAQLRQWLDEYRPTRSVDRDGEFA